MERLMNTKVFTKLVGLRSQLMREVVSLQAVLLAVLACSPDMDRGDDPEHAAVLVRDRAGVRIVQNPTVCDGCVWSVSDTPILSIGTADGDPNDVLFQVVDALALEDGSIVVANGGSQQLVFFDSTGQYTHAAGGSGGGPGEFTLLVSVFRGKGASLVAVDMASRRVSYFDSDGNYGRSTRLIPFPELPAPLALGMFTDGTLLATQGAYTLRAEPPTRIERDSQSLYCYSADGANVTHLGRFPGQEWTIVTTLTPDGRSQFGRRRREFGRSTAYAVSGNSFYVADNAAFEIQIYSNNAELHTVIRREYAALPVTDTDIKSYRDSVIASRGNALQQRRTRDLHTRLPRPPEYMPAYAPDIETDTHGNLWVRETTRPGENRAPWSVFDESGVLVGVVEMPVGFMVMDIGSDYVLGVRRDELDIEYVELRSLSKGT